jgi:hypothetical protein
MAPLDFNFLPICVRYVVCFFVFLFFTGKTVLADLACGFLKTNLFFTSFSLKNFIYSLSPLVYFRALHTNDIAHGFSCICIASTLVGGSSIKSIRQMSCLETIFL